MGINYGKIFAIGGNSIFKDVLLNYFDNLDLIYHTEIQNYS